MPFTFEGDGFWGGGYATSVLINFFNEEIDCGGADFFGLLVGPADFAFFGSPVQVDEGDVLGDAPAVGAEPSEDGAVVSDDGVRLFFSDPSDKGSFIKLIDDQGGDFSFLGMDGLPTEVAC